MSDIKFSRAWCMPSGNTFSIKPIGELIQRYISGLNEGAMIVDPFANTSTFGNVTNDLDPNSPAMYHMDAYDFLRGLSTEFTDMVLFDPPYSSRQVSECYKKFGKTVDMTTTQATYWTKLRSEIARIVKPGGICISCGWNSGGIGKTNGFEIVEILLVAHGGIHNDTIVTVDRKIE